MPHIKNFRHAVDIGGHAGLWSRPLTACFRHVTAFEPVQAHIQCWLANVPSENTTLHQYALGDHAGQVSLHTGPASSGDTYVQQGGEHSAEMRTLDSFELQHIDFAKLDCEGYELYALKGGERTIRRDKPCIIVEQKPGKGKQFGLGDHDAVVLLKSWGAQQVGEIAGDFILRWK
jgi:FkbM family methyltransferase